MDSRHRGCGATGDPLSNIMCDLSLAETVVPNVNIQAAGDLLENALAQGFSEKLIKNREGPITVQANGTPGQIEQEDRGESKLGYGRTFSTMLTPSTQLS